MENTNTPANELGTDETATSETTNTENAVTEAVTVVTGVPLFRTISQTINQELGIRTIVEAMETSQGCLVKTITFKDLVNKKVADVLDEQLNDLSYDVRLKLEPLIDLSKTFTYHTECTTFIPAVKLVEVSDGNFTIK